MLRNTRLNYDFYKLFSKIIVYNSVILVTLAFIEKITSKEILFPSSWAQSIFYADNFLRVYGMFNNPNTFGAYLSFSVIIVLYLERHLRIKTNGIFYLFSISGIILTASRSSMISLGMVIVTSIFLFDKKEMIKKFTINIVAAILIVFCINNLSEFYINNIASNDSRIELRKGSANSAVDRLEELSNPAIISKSKTDGRIFSIMKGIEIFKNNLVIGTGFGSYGDAASLIIPPKQYNTYEISEGFYADNEYIKVLVETGVIGAIMYSLFLISIIVNYKKSSFKLMACLVLGFLGMFYNIFEVQILSYLFWITLTLPEKGNNFKLHRG